MKTLFLLSVLLLLLGCNTPTKNISAETYISPRIETIINASDTIDGYLVNSPLKSNVRAHTDTIRNTVFELRFEKVDSFYISQISNLKKENEQKVSVLNKIIKEKDKTIVDANLIIKKQNKEIDNLKNEARENQTTILTWVATIVIIASGVLLYFGQKGLAGIGVTVSMLLFGVVQVIGNPLFVWCIFGLILVCIIASFYLFYKQKIKNETNIIVMSELEKFYNKQTDETKKWMDDTLFVELSKKMDLVHKNFVKDVELKNE